MQALQVIILNVERYAFGKLERLGALLLMESHSRRGLIENYHPQHGWLVFFVAFARSVCEAEQRFLYRHTEIPAGGHVCPKRYFAVRIKRREVIFMAHNYGIVFTPGVTNQIPSIGISSTAGKEIFRLRC